MMKLHIQMESESDQYVVEPSHLWTSFIVKYFMRDQVKF